MLLEGDGGREAVDGIDLRNAELMEKAPGVGRDGFEVAALRLGVKRPEGERRLPRPGDAGENDQRITGNADVDVLEVVLSGATDVNELVVSAAESRSAAVASVRRRLCHAGRPSKIRA